MKPCLPFLTGRFWKLSRSHAPAYAGREILAVLYFLRGSKSMTKEEFINRLDLAILMAESNGLSETRLALIDIRSQVMGLSSEYLLHHSNPSTASLRLC